jgi:glycerophosphoryl diester phosphodiesterase
MPDRQINFFPPFIAAGGACIRAPENTMASFAAAREDGAGWIEADVKLTADGIAILMHDDTLDRTTNGRGNVADMTWAQMRDLDAGSWFAPSFTGTRVPALAELLAFARATGMRLNLEIKPCPGRARATTIVALIEIAKAWPEAALPPLISSFDIEALTVAAQLHPGWPRGLLLAQWREDWREVMTLTRATTLNINADLLTPERLAILRQTHVPMLAWNVSDAAQARDLFAGGVKAVFCDDPAQLLKAA